eukprot:4512592-Pleurochrysis_carterae.AAC.1
MLSSKLSSYSAYAISDVSHASKTVGCKAVHVGLKRLEGAHCMAVELEANSTTAFAARTHRW